MYTKDIPTIKTIELVSNQFLEYYSFPLDGQTKIENIGDIGYKAVCSHIDWKIDEIQNLVDVPLDLPRLFVVKPYDTLIAHKDCVRKSSHIREWAINIPIFGCAEGHNVWYDDQPDFEYDENIFPYTHVLTSPLPAPSHREKLNCVKLFRTNIAHSVDNKDNKNYRVVLSLRSSVEKTWEEMYESI